MPSFHRKSLSSALLMALMGIFPLFAVEVVLPGDKVGDDVNIHSEHDGQRNSTVWGNEDTLFNGINIVNKYLWWSFAVLALGLTVYAGYEAITAWGDQKALKKAMWTLIGVAVGIAIAMLSAALIKIIVNLL